MAPGVAIEETCRKAGEDRNVKARYVPVFNPLNAELNPICHLLALLGAHHILSVSRIRVNEALRPEDVVVIGDKASTNS